jgi:hypothetical protein
MSQTSPYTVHKPTATYVFMIGTTLLSPLYSPHIHSFSVRGFLVLKGLNFSPMPHLLAHMSTAVRCWTRRGDAGARCPERPRSFLVASRRETTPATLLDPLSFPYQGEHADELAGRWSRWSVPLDGRTHAHSHAYTLIHARAHAHTYWHARKRRHVRAHWHTHMLTDTFIHRDTHWHNTHTAAAAQEEEWCVAHVWELPKAELCDLSYAMFGVPWATDRHAFRSFSECAQKLSYTLHCEH